MGACVVPTGAWASDTTTGPYAPPWHVGPMVPLARNILSLEVLEHDTPVWLEPSGKRRGSVQGSARLPIFGSRPASGQCKSRWFLVGVSAWVCGEAVVPSTYPPTTASESEQPSGLPYDYYFVGPDGALAYGNRALFGEGIPDSQLEPGFAVAVRQTVESRGERLGYSSNGLWLLLDDLVPIRGSAFVGVHAAGGESLDLVWNVGSNTKVLDRPNGKFVRKLERRVGLRVLERLVNAKVMWLRIGLNEWVRASDVRSVAARELPSDLSPNERWIDVDLRSQVLEAREGERVVFSTLVSTGRGTGTQESATPVGEHRIWVKLSTSDMSNVEDDAASAYYAIEAVPWVMFFKAGYALHAAFWHGDFGARRSHGCINLSPKDAQFLFHWTAPVMPSGWHAVHPIASDLGTRVRVR